MRRLGLILAPLLIVAIAALAQSDESGETNENGFLANLLENTLSAPGRQIRLQDVSGLLSSTATIGLITISDDEGVWARVDGAELDWSRASLLLGRVTVNSVSADRIEVLEHLSAQLGVSSAPPPSSSRAPAGTSPTMARATAAHPPPTRSTRKTHPRQNRQLHRRPRARRANPRDPLPPRAPRSPEPLSIKQLILMNFSDQRPSRSLGCCVLGSESTWSRGTAEHAASRRSAADDGGDHGRSKAHRCQRNRTQNR